MGKQENQDPTESVAYRLGNYVENRIGTDISRRFEAPVLEGMPDNQIWYRIRIPEGIAGDGSAYHIYLKQADPEKVCVFLSGGGVAWNEYTAARPVTGGKVAAGLPNYYWNNLRPFTQIMNIHTGITEINNRQNPFRDWSFIIITYATGDFHVGDHDFPYTGEDGNPNILHFHGHRNFLAGMKTGCSFFPDPKKLLIAGDSAGAFAVPALTEEILELFYPDCTDVTLLSDSGQLLNKNWRKTVRDVWRADERLWRVIHGKNLTVDWYRALHDRYGGRLTYLYASSVRDYLLSAYYNDITKKEYKTDEEVQEKFRKQAVRMARELKEITPQFGMFFYDWKNHRFRLGGTVHTAVRHRRFFYKGKRPASMAQWLYDAAEGRVYDIGMELLGL